MINMGEGMGRWDLATRRLVMASRWLFILTAVLASLIFWLAPHPPMNDLPQHAGQVTALRDLLLNQSRWADLLRLNFFTPYLIGYGLALPLSMVMPVAVTLKLLLSLSYLAFVAICVYTRRHFDGDQRLDWLFVPTFFGFAYKWGLFTYLIAAPLGLAFMLLADIYAAKPSSRRGGYIFLAGLLLFMAHGLVFIFGFATGVAFVAIRHRRLVDTLRAFVPYLGIAVACVAYFVISQSAEADMAYVPGIIWEWDWKRPFKLLLFALGTGEDSIFLPIAILLAGMPFVLGARINRTKVSLIPLACLLAIYMSLPMFAMNTAFLYNRFALFFLPCYAWVFGRATEAGARNVSEHRRIALTVVILSMACWGFLAMQGLRVVRFGQESADFDRVATATLSGRRALMMIFDSSSEAANNPWIYQNYALWYQAEKSGLVDFNFAWFRPAIVRYRIDSAPAVTPQNVGRLVWDTGRFGWEKYQGMRYDYFFVRHTAALPPNLFKDAPCEVVELKSSGPWSVYGRRDCH